MSHSTSAIAVDGVEDGMPCPLDPVPIFSTSDRFLSDVLLLSKVRFSVNLKSASNVQLSDWLTDRISQSDSCTFEADYRIGLKCTEFHTFEAEIIYFLM